MNLKIITLIMVVIAVLVLGLLWKTEEPPITESQPANVVQGVNEATPTTTPTVATSTVKTSISPVPTPTPTSNLNIIKRLLPNENSESRSTPITHAMIHFISNVSAKPNDPHNIQDIINIFLTTGLSSHYLIGRDGTVYQLTAENRVAYHGGKGELAKFPTYTNKINHYSIGIEIAAIGTKEEMSEFISAEKYDALAKNDIGYTSAQYASLNKLLDEIYKKNPAVKKDRDHVIGHDEYAPDRKHDPGSLFDWSRIGF